MKILKKVRILFLAVLKESSGYHLLSYLSTGLTAFLRKERKESSCMYLVSQALNFCQFLITVN